MSIILSEPSMPSPSNPAFHQELELAKLWWSGLSFDQQEYAKTKTAYTVLDNIIIESYLTRDILHTDRDWPENKFREI